MKIGTNTIINMEMIKQTKFILTAFLLSGLLVIVSCSDDEGPAALEIDAITATGTDLTTGNQTTVDLNAATSPTGVPVDPTIEIVFSRDVDATTVTASSVTLSDGTTPVSLGVTATGGTATVTLNEELEGGTDYTLTLGGGIMAADGGAFAETSRTFKTGGRQEVTPPQESSQVAYWKFDGDATDETGTYDANAEVAIEYQADRFGIVSSAAYFDGDASIIEVPNASPLLDATNSFTVSFWMNVDTVGHVNADGNQTGMFVWGLGAFFGIQYEIFDNYDGSKFAISYENSEGAEYSEDMWFPNGATDNTTGGWQGWTFAQSLTAQEMKSTLTADWLHIVYTYDAAEKVGSLYFDGDLMKSFDFDLWPDGGAKQLTTGINYRGSAPDVVDDLAFGFIHSRAGTMWDAEPWGGYDFTTSKHFKGWLDDFRIFNAALSATEVQSLHDQEAP